MDSGNLRKQLLHERDGLSREMCLQHSAEIVRKCLSLQQLADAETIFLYMNFRSEVITEDFIETLIGMGKRVVLPVTLTGSRKLLPVYIKDIKKDLAPGYASIPEPVAEIRKSRAAAPENIDIIFLPGSVFDERGGRMGYGGGYYDRFVSEEAPQALRIGIAYEMQVVEEAPLQPHDELLDFIITEKRQIHGSRENHAKNSNI